MNQRKTPKLRITGLFTRRPACGSDAAGVGRGARQKMSAEGPRRRGKRTAARGFL
jgi:hypothetical protein